MRLFQNLGISLAYRRRLALLMQGRESFIDRLSVFLQDRYGASHLLKPVLDHDSSAFLTYGNAVGLQQAWAREHGLPRTTDAAKILLAQIEEHRADVFYNLDPLRFDSSFVRRLPSCVKKSICWRSAPSPGANFGAYDLVVCNFPIFMDMWRALGFRTAYFVPAHDPRMDDFVGADERRIDVSFVGVYSRHHVGRAQVLEVIARECANYNIVFCLDRSRLTRLAESPAGLVPPLKRYRRPSAIRRVSSEPVFGLDLYKTIGNSKIVLNGAGEIAGPDRGNMRCFEALGCGALMVSDSGHYPDGFVSGENMLTYDTPKEAARLIARALDEWPSAESIASKGYEMVRTRYSKESQWRSFLGLVDAL